MALGAQRVEIKWNEKDKQVSTSQKNKQKENKPNAYKGDKQVSASQKNKQKENKPNAYKGDKQVSASQKNKQKENKPNAYKGPSWIERAWKAKWIAELDYKYGWEVAGIEISQDYNLRALHDVDSVILDLSFFYKWIHFSLGYGYTEGGDLYIAKGYGFKRAEVYRFKWAPSLHIPFVNYQNTFQFFGILGYRFESIGYSFDNEYYRFFISGPFYGAKIRCIYARDFDMSHVKSIGFDFSIENVLLIDKVDGDQPDFRIYKIAFVFTYE
jgi:hypothetical protein